MCKQVRCTRCGKVGWAGCGAHVEAVLRGVPEAERCRCDAQPKAPSPASDGGAKKRWWSF